MNNLEIAKICHSVNKQYCIAIGDNSQVDWDELPVNIQNSIIDGVNHHIDNEDSTPSDSHKNWLKFKQAEGGWKYGKVKDLEKKIHPCFRPFNSLPQADQAKDFIFMGIVKALKEDAS